jgi:hypothetical protein
MALVELAEETPTILNSGHPRSIREDPVVPVRAPYKQLGVVAAHSQLKFDHGEACMFNCFQYTTSEIPNGYHANKVR